MILIATDEAGYGPKLGPLVVAASAWKLTRPGPGGGDFGAGAGNTNATHAELTRAEPTRPEATRAEAFGADELTNAFAKLAAPARIDGKWITVDDSKSIFKPRSASAHAAKGYAALECVTLAASRWCGIADARLHLVDDLAAADKASISAAPWLATFAAESIATQPGCSLIASWQHGSAQLCDLQTRVITAESFNRSCGEGRNKSDLLSNTTLSLVKTLLDRIDRSPDEPAVVYCDRHGGRRYYAAALQQTFDGTLVRVISESKTESRYRVPYDDGEFSIHFTVKGDSFTPVAFSSMVAKYLREKAMESLNGYFGNRHQGHDPLRPTAGYPVDADRFLADIRPTIQREQVDCVKLVRSR